MNECAIENGIENFCCWKFILKENPQQQQQQQQQQQNYGKKE